MKIDTVFYTVQNINGGYAYTGGAVNNYCPAPITSEDERQRVLDFMDGKLSLPY